MTAVPIHENYQYCLAVLRLKPSPIAWIQALEISQNLGVFFSQNSAVMRIYQR